MFRSSHIFVFWFFVFWTHDFLIVFFCLAHLALQNVNKDHIIFSYFRNFVAKSDRKPKVKNGMNEAMVEEGVKKLGNLVTCHLWMAPQVIMDGKWAAERPTYQLLSWSLNALLNNVNNKLMIVPNMFNFLETSRIMTM